MAEVFTPGRVLGDRYRLDHKLARGGMATVWVAEDPLLSRMVAVKLLHPELAVDEALRARFRNEAIAAARLTHPGIVATYDTGDDDGVAYIVMELVDGFNLRHILDRNGRLAVSDAVNIATQVADALDHAHRHGLVHRDVKPANVLVQPDGRVKVTDFGIAKAAGTDDLTRTGTVIGTARYLAPEQVNGEVVDARADVYALGLVLFEMLTGRPPFGGDTDVATAVARLTSAPDPVRSVRPEVPRAVEDIVARSLARDPNYRYASAKDLRDALAGSKRPGSTGAPSFAPPKPSPRPTASEPQTPAPIPLRPMPTSARTAHSPRWPWLVLALVLAGAAVAGYYFATRDGGGSAGGTLVGNPLPISIVDARDFDPLGGDGESPDEVDQLFDADAGTAWSTETYESPREEFGGGKAGVGVTFDLGGTHDISEVTVHTDNDGWNGEIRVSDSRGSALSDWGRARSSGIDLDRDVTFKLVPAASGRYVLVWLTRLPSNGRLGITEVSVAGA